MFQLAQVSSFPKDSQCWSLARHLLCDLFQEQRQWPSKSKVGSDPFSPRKEASRRAGPNRCGQSSLAVGTQCVHCFSFWNYQAVKLWIKHHTRQLKVTCHKLETWSSEVQSFRILVHHKNPWSLSYCLFESLSSYYYTFIPFGFL